MDALSAWIDMPRPLVRLSAQDPGGDALDAVIAGLGAAQAWQRTDLDAVASDPLFRREGYLFV